MAKKTTTGETRSLEDRLTMLEARMTILMTLAKSTQKVARQKREYTDEQRATIRARLLAGQEAARKRREAEAAKKTKPVKHLPPVEPK